MGRCGDPLLDLRELYDGLSDVFLYNGGRRDGLDRPTRGTVADLGLVLYVRFFVHSWRQRARNAEVALSPMDDSQAGNLERSIRTVRLRGMRTLHHLVSGRN
jgi:hypothetical protein